MRFARLLILGITAALGCAGGQPRAKAPAAQSFRALNSHTEIVRAARSKQIIILGIGVDSSAEHSRAPSTTAASLPLSESLAVFGVTTARGSIADGVDGGAAAARRALALIGSRLPAKTELVAGLLPDGALLPVATAQARIEELYKAGKKQVIVATSQALAAGFIARMAGRGVRITHAASLEDALHTLHPEWPLRAPAKIQYSERDARGVRQRLMKVMAPVLAAQTAGGQPPVLGDAARRVGALVALAERSDSPDHALLSEALILAEAVAIARARLLTAAKESAAPMEAIQQRLAAALARLKDQRESLAQIHSTKSLLLAGEHLAMAHFELERAQNENAQLSGDEASTTLSLRVTHTLALAVAVGRAERELAALAQVPTGQPDAALPSFVAPEIARKSPYPAFNRRLMAAKTLPDLSSLSQRQQTLLRSGAQLGAWRAWLLHGVAQRLGISTAGPDGFPQVAEAGRQRAESLRAAVLTQAGRSTQSLNALATSSTQTHARPPSSLFAAMDHALGRSLRSLLAIDAKLPRPLPGVPAASP